MMRTWLLLGLNIFILLPLLTQRLKQNGQDPEIYYFSSSQDGFIVETVTTQNQYVLAASNLPENSRSRINGAWSATQNWFVWSFFNASTGFRSIEIVNRDGTERLPVANIAGTLTTFDWSPSDDNLLINTQPSNGELISILFNPTESPEPTIPSQQLVLEWTNSGRYIVGYPDGGMEIYSNTGQRIAERNLFCCRAFWSPDDSVLYRQNAQNYILEDIVNNSIIEIRLPQQIMFVDWSSDGSHAILYGGDRFPDGNTWLFDTMDGSTTRITENATRTTLPSHLTITESGWSPDGQRVWIRADQLLLVERSGEVQAITDNFSGGLYYNSVEWNDPEQLLFGSRIDADENGVNIFDISTQQSTEIVADDLLMNFSMSPTNNFLAYFAYCDDGEVFGLCILNMAEGEIQIYPSDPQESQGTGPLIWHIEQDILLYGESDIGSGTIYLIEPDANSRRTITTCSNFLEPCFGWLSGMRE